MTDIQSSDSTFDTLTDETALALQNGDIDTAVRVSGRLLATCDNNLRTLYNARKPLSDAAVDFIGAALLHVHALRIARLPDEAFSCAIGALLTVDIYHSSDTIDNARKAMLYNYALRSAIDCFDNMGEAADNISEDHRGYIMSYLASLLYHYYSQAVKNQSDNPALTEIYNFLKAIGDSGAIQTPTIKLGEQDVDPSSPGPLLVDILSRAAALGLLT